MIDDLLIELGACIEARIWAKGKSWQEIYTTCPRGDWLLWLFYRTNREDIKRLNLAKGHYNDTAAADATANRQLLADICRKYLPFEIWNIKEQQ